MSEVEVEVGQGQVGDLAVGSENAGLQHDKSAVEG